MHFKILQIAQEESENKIMKSVVKYSYSDVQSP